MAEEEKNDKAVAEEESPTPKNRGEKLYTAEDVGKFMAMQAYGTDPRQRYGYYAQTTVPQRRKAAGTALGIGVGGAVAQRALQASAMFDPALAYARSEAAEAAAKERAPTPKVSYEEKAGIRAAAIAPVQTEIAETKMDVGSLMSSRGGASVRDILAARETGQQAIGSAAIEAEALIAKKELAGIEAHNREVAKAEKRQDEMQQTLYEARAEQRGYTSELLGDVVKAATEYAANAPAADETPVVDRLLDKGVPFDQIGDLHKAAMAKGFYPGSQAYNNYLMSHYEGVTPKAAPGEAKADVTGPVAGAPVDELEKTVAVQPSETEEDQSEGWDVVAPVDTEPGQPPSYMETRMYGTTPPKLSTAEQIAAGGGTSGEGRITGMMEQPPQAAAIAKIGEGFSAGETADLYSLADEAGLKRDQYSIEEIQGMEHKDGPLYRIKLNEGVRLPEAAPTPSAAAPLKPLNFKKLSSLGYQYRRLEERSQKLQLASIERGEHPLTNPRLAEIHRKASQINNEMQTLGRQSGLEEESRKLLIGDDEWWKTIMKNKATIYEATRGATPVDQPK